VAVPLAVIVVVLLAALHCHVAEHRVPHPISEKVCVANHVVEQRQQLRFNPVAVVVSDLISDPQHLLVIWVVVTISTAVLPAAQFSFLLRGPPLIFLLYAS
jgi:hypothetical protein